MVQVAAVAAGTAQAGIHIHVTIMVSQEAAGTDGAEAEATVRPRRSSSQPIVAEDKEATVRPRRSSSQPIMAEDQKASVGPQRVSSPPIVAPGVPLTFCPLALKWRNPATGRFAKTPAAVLLTQEEKAYVAECKAAAAAVRRKRNQ